MLRLPTMRARFGEVADAAQREQLDLPRVPRRAADGRVRRPRPRRSARRITAAGFPREKWLQDFDYAANPHIQPAVIAQLATSAWVSKGEPLCLIGDSGTGKSHLLIGLGAANPANCNEVSSSRLCISGSPPVITASLPGCWSAPSTTML